MPDPERGRRMVGCGCWTLGMMVGAVLLVLLFVLFPAVTGIGAAMLEAMCIGAALAIPGMVVYLTVPRLLDRYDPEPWYALLMALAWGAVAACGIAALINSVVEAAIGGDVGAFVGMVISAPVVEEAAKGILVLGYFYFLRREFDGVVDGIIYATFVAIGFAAVENVIYYARAGLDPEQGALQVTFLLRGVLTPWAHPLFTSMTGIGVGVARETSKTWVRFAAPLAGYAGAVTLHAIWNGATTLPGGGMIVCLMLPLWLIFVATFLIIVAVLVRRRGSIIRAHLVDEVALGHLSQQELDLVASAFGGLTAYFRKGRQGTEFVRAVARLALSKWHSARAMKQVKHTVSMDFILPLRRKIKDLRDRGASPVR
ncbi:MAG: PrsW family intramembrane metalloprotease [Sandaracinaceae bacterium]|nr:PrsW family intramembrane metalloprotease [Sandaracinaceae bacterium]